MTHSPAATAWQELLDALAAAGEVIEGPLGATNERERAEGYRHLLRLLSVASEQLLEKGDVLRPRLTRWMSPHRKLLGDNPQTYYDTCQIDPDVTYVIRGSRGTSTYLGICVYATAENGARRIVANLDDVDLAIADDGTFAVTLGRERPAGPGSFIALSDDTTDVMIRQYFGDRATEIDATYEIAAVPEPDPVPTLSESELVERLGAVGDFVTDVIEVEATLSTLMASATPQLLRAGDDYVDAEGKATAPPVDPTVVAKAMPSPAIQYSGSWFDNLGDDEVVIVEGTPPTCRYWSIQLMSRWMESLDWTGFRCFLTGRDIALADDGTFRVVIAHRDPGEPNWIDTTGMRTGNIAVRALGADGLLDVRFRRERR